MRELDPKGEALLQKEYTEKVRELVTERSKRLGRPLYAHISTFGCQMNARDSEKLMGILLEAGFVESDTEEADLVLYNTCTVRENANERVYGRLGHMKAYKRTHPDTLIAICGCMMQESSEVRRVREKYPFVDIVFGTHNIFKFAQLLY